MVKFSGVNEMADSQPQQAKIERLDNDYTRQIAQEQLAAHRHRGLSQRRAKRAVRIVAVFAVFALFLGIQLIQTNVGRHKVERQVVASRERLAKTKHTNAELRAQVKQLNDKDYLGQLIRSKYYYSKTNETIYSLPGDHASDVTAK